MGAEPREIVLGGDGLIGSTLVKELKARGREVLSFDLKSGVDLRYAKDSLFDWRGGGSVIYAPTTFNYR